jgi:orotate phosphoribosyltransferase-like protein
MPKIYREDDLRKVWVAFRDQDLRRSEIADALNISTEEVDSMYEAARKRFKYGAAERDYKRKNPLLPSASDRITVPGTREKGRYSNRSPMGIASPGYGEQLETGL